MFWFITALFGFQLGDAAVIITWVAVVFVSILIHELGHALALAAFGQRSSIIIHGFGGLTVSQRQLSRGQSIAVSLAGPAAALALLGLPAMTWIQLHGDQLQLDWALGGFGFGIYPVIRFAAWVNVWWSLANLLPIRPLDGGNVTTEIFGIGRARVLSIVVGAGVAVAAFILAPELRFAALFAAFLAFANYGEHARAKKGPSGPSAFDVDAPTPPGGGGVLPGHHGRSTPHKRKRRRRGGGSLRSVGPNESAPAAAGAAPDARAPTDPASVEALAWTLLRRGDGAGALRLLGRASGPVDPFCHGAATVAAGGAIDRLIDAYRGRPGGPHNLVPATVLADHGRAIEAAERLLESGDAASREAVGALHTHLHYAERFGLAAAVGERLFDASPSVPAQVAFDTAASWARVPEATTALAWLERAIGLGFTAVGVLDGDPDLASLRADPRWAEVRSQVSKDS